MLANMRNPRCKPKWEREGCLNSFSSSALSWLWLLAIQPVTTGASQRDTAGQAGPCRCERPGYW